MTKTQTNLATYFYLLWVAEADAADYAEWVQYHEKLDGLTGAILRTVLGVDNYGQLLNLCEA